MANSAVRGVARNSAGAAVGSPTVTVYQSGTLTLASIFDDVGGAKANPFTGDTDAEWEFYAPAWSLFDVKVEAAGFTTWNKRVRVGGTGDHGELSGLADNDHPQYGLLAGVQTWTAQQTFQAPVILNNSFNSRLEMQIGGVPRGHLYTNGSTFDVILASLNADGTTVNASVSLLAGVVTVAGTFRTALAGGTEVAKFSRTDSGTCWITVQSEGTTNRADLRLGGGNKTWAFAARGDSTFAFTSITDATFPFVAEASAPTDSLRIAASGVALFGSGSFGGASKALFVGDATTAPTSAPTGGVIVFSSGSRLQVRETSSNRYLVQAAASTKTTAGAPYTNDGYVEVVINGTIRRLMTTA